MSTKKKGATRKPAAKPATRRTARAASGADLRRIALAQADAVETITWGEPHFRIHDRIFTGLGKRDGRDVTSVKLDKQHAEARLLDPRFRPAPYVGRYGWVEFALEDVNVGELRALIEESYRLVAREPAKAAKPGKAVTPAGSSKPAKAASKEPARPVRRTAPRSPRGTSGGSRGA